MADIFSEETEKYLSFVAQDILEDAGAYPNTIPRRIARRRRDYGFEKMILSGDYVPEPSFTNNRVTCFSQALEIFLIAEKIDEIRPGLGLDPRFYLVSGLKDVEEIRKEREEISGDRSRISSLEDIVAAVADEGFCEIGGFEHAIVDVHLPGRKSRFLIDPQLGHVGRARFDHENQRILLHPSLYAKWEALAYDTILELTKKELLERVAFYRTDEGSVRMLECGQRIRTFRHIDILHAHYIKYKPSRNSLISQVQMSMPVISDSVVTNEISLDGNAEVKSQMLEFSICRKLDWMRQVGKRSLGTYDLQDVRAFWKALEISLKDHYKDPAAFLRKTNYEPALRKIRSFGIPNMLDKRNTLPEDLPEDIAKRVSRLAAQATLHFIDGIHDRKTFAAWVMRHNRRVVYEELLGDREYIYPYEDHVKVFPVLRREMSFFASRVHNLEMEAEELANGIKLKGKTLSGTLKELRRLRDRYLSLKDKYDGYLVFASISKPLFRRIRDMMVAAERREDKIRPLDELFVSDPGQYLDRFWDGMHTEFCNELEKAMLKAYQVKGSITLRKYLKHVQPKIKGYLSAGF